MRIVAGLWLLQLVTAGIVLLVVADGATSVPRLALAAGLALLTGLIVAVWLGGQARDRERLGHAERRAQEAQTTARHHEALARARADHAAELAGLAARATDARTGRARAALLLGGAVGVGGTFLLTQFLTLGLVVVAFASGGLVGYALRGRLMRVGDRLRAPSADAAQEVIAGRARAVPADRQLSADGAPDGAPD